MPSRLTRAILAAGYLLGLRGRDLLSAREFIKIAYPGEGTPARLLKFARWALYTFWRRLPDASAWAQVDAGVSTTPYWQIAPNPHANHPWNKDPRAVVPQSAEVVVIGAGFGGASVAYHWSKLSDKALVLLEMNDPASGSAGRNGGFVVRAGGAYHGYYVYGGVSSYLEKNMPDLTTTERDALAARFADVYVRALHASHESIVQTIERESIDCDYQRHGWVHVSDRVDLPKVEESLALAARLGHADWVRLTPAEILARSGAHTALDGALSIGTATWHPAKWVWGLLAAALKNPSVGLFTRTRVSRVEGGPRAYTVFTDRGTIQAPYVVNASDSHTPRLFREHLSRFPGLITPYRVQGIHAEGGPPLLPKQIAVSNKLGFYSRLGSGGVLFGTDHSPVPPHEAGDNQPSRFVTRLMCAEMGDQWGPAPTRVTHQWTGTVGVSPDWFPVIGPMDDRGLYILSGFAGAGSVVSFNGGEHVARRILGMPCDPEYHPDEFFSPARFADLKAYGRADGKSRGES